MSDEGFTVPIRIQGELRPPCIIALETAMDMCKEAGWSVETVIVHKMSPGLSMWRLDARSGEEPV
jgi:hypothetical protein